MTIPLTIWRLLTGNPIARLLAKIGGLVLLVVTFGAWQRREGAQGQKAKTDAAQAKATIQAHEVRNEVEDDIARGGSAKQRLRERWRRP